MTAKHIESDAIIIHTKGETMNNKTHDTIIIGGGIAGLTAAILLAERGQNVIIYERAAELGGRAQTRDRDGFKFNFGPHALYRGNAGFKLLKKMGITLTGDIPKYGKHPLAVTATESGLLPATPLGMMRSTLFAGRRLALVRAIIALMTANPRKLQRVTWRNWLDQNIADPRARDLIEMLGRVSTYANAPELMSAGATIRQSKSAFLSNVLYMDDGWAQMLDKLVDKANAIGVTIETGASVKSVESADDGVSVWVGDAKEPVQAKHVIAAVPPQSAQKLLPQSTALAEAVSTIQPIVVACLTLGLRKLPKPKTLIAQGLGIPFYTSTHSASAKLAPSGQALLQAAIYIAPDDDRTPDQHRAALDQWLDQIQPGWREQIETSEFLPRMTVVHSFMEAGQKRPPITIADLPNVYVIGDWVESTEMLADGSFASAQMAADIIAS